MGLNLSTISHSGGGGMSAHKETHQLGGSDAIKLDDLAEPDDNTDLNFSTLRHGLCPKGTNVGNFLRDDGTWAAAGGKTLFECVVAPSGGDYTTLGAAIAAGKTRIFVRNGTYAESGEYTIPANCVIIGESKYGAIIDVSGTTNHRILIADTATKVSLKNLTFKDSTTQDWLIEPASTNASHSDILIENCYFEKGGVMLGGTGTSSTIYNVVIQNCKFYNVGVTYGSIRIRARVATGGEITGLRILNNYIQAGNITSGYYNIGVTGYYGRGNIIANNYVYNGRNSGTVYAIYVSLTDITNVSEVKIVNNYCEDYSSYYIYLNGGSSNENTAIISDNVIIVGGGTNSYIVSNFSNTIIRNNVISCNASYGGTLIQIMANGDRTSVIGNLLYGGSLATGITIDSGADDCFIDGNYFAYPSGFSTFINDSGTNTHIGDNQGLPASDVKKYVRMKNTSGAALAAGNVVILKSVAAGNEVTTTITGGDSKVFGMAIEPINDAAWGRIQILGKTTSLKVNGIVDIAVGDYLSTYTEAGIAKKASSGETAFAIALEAYAGDDSNGVIDALLISPRII